MQPNQHDYDTPYRETFRVKLTEFPCGGREAVCFNETVYHPNGAELAHRARVAVRGHEIWRGGAVELSEGELEVKRMDNVARAARRASRSVRIFVRRIAADHLLTVTYRENVEDYERAKADWKAFVRSVRARYPEWRYVVVTEKQERGAIHFHAAVVGFQNVNFLRECWYKAVGRGLGNIDVKGPPKRWAAGGATWKAQKLSGYLTKYMSKAFDASLHHAKRYWASHDAPPVRVTAFYLQSDSMDGAIRQTFSIVAGGLAIDVSQWLSDRGSVYWVSSARPPSTPF